MDEAKLEEAKREAGLHHEAYLQRKGTQETDTPTTVAAEYYSAFPERIAELLELSSKDRASWDAVSLVAQQLLRAGDPLPPALVTWVVDVIEDASNPKAPKRRPRPGGRPEKWMLNQAIRGAVRDLLRLRLGFKATRSDATESKSVCDVVASAFDLEYKTVENVWTARDKRFDD